MKKLWKKIQNAIDTFKCMNCMSKTVIISIPLVLIYLTLSTVNFIHNTKGKKQIELPTAEILFPDVHDKDCMDSGDIFRSNEINEDCCQPLTDLDEYWDSINVCQSNKAPLHNCVNEQRYEYWTADDRGDIECKMMTREEYMQEERNQKAEIMNILLSTDKGKVFLHYSVILIGMALLFLAFIFFLITWRAIKRLTRPKTIKKTIKQVCEIPEDVLRKDDVYPWYNKDYLATLKDKYEYYGDENNKEFVEWAYRRITRSDDFKSEDREHIINQLKWGYILDLRDYDWLVRLCEKRDYTFDEQEAIVNKLKSWDNYNNEVRERPLKTISEFKNEEWPLEKNKPCNIDCRASVDDLIYQGIDEQDDNNFETLQCEEPYEDYCEGEESFATNK